MAYTDRCRNPRTPRIFGTGSRTEVLVMLAVHGPTPARRIARLWQVGRQPAFSWIKLLERSGVVEKRSLGARYPGLNRAYRLADSVYSLLTALAKRFKPPDPGVPKWRSGFQTTATSKPKTLGREADYLFGSPNRTRILVFVAIAGPIAVRDVARSLGIHFDSARSAVKRLEADRLLSGRRVGRCRLVSLNPRLTGAKQLRRLLLCVARYHTYYRDLRSAFRITKDGRVGSRLLPAKAAAVRNA